MFPVFSAGSSGVASEEISSSCLADDASDSKVASASEMTTVEDVVEEGMGTGMV